MYKAFVEGHSREVVIRVVTGPLGPFYSCGERGLLNLSLAKLHHLVFDLCLICADSVITILGYCKVTANVYIQDCTKTM